MVESCTVYTYSIQMGGERWASYDGGGQMDYWREQKVREHGIGVGG